MKKTKITLGRLNLRFPNYFKKVGIALIVASFCLFVLARIFDFPIDKETLKTIFLNLLIFSCVLIAMARDKVEDELTSQIKLMSGFVAFLSAPIAFLFASIYPFRSNDDSMFLEVPGLLFFMFLMFFMTKYGLTKQSKNEELD